MFVRAPWSRATTPLAASAPPGTAIDPRARAGALLGALAASGGRGAAAALAVALVLALALAPNVRAASAADPQAAAEEWRVVLDPGHGGDERGAEGPAGIVEKELTLDVARRLAAMLRADGFEVTMTREGDEGLGLDERAGVANNRRADVFISLHANASRFAAASGAETYVLSREATDDAARTTAALENDAAGVGDAAVDDSGELPLILWDLAQVAYLEDSARLASVIQQTLNGALGLRDRGVRQAPFSVLRGATCPAVLVELGFLTNTEDEKALASAEHRARLAEALADALRQYRAQALPRTRP